MSQACVVSTSLDEFVLFCMLEILSSFDFPWKGYVGIFTLYILFIKQYRTIIFFIKNDRQTDRLTDGQTDWWTDRQTDRQTEIKTDILEYRQKGRQEDRPTDRQAQRQTDKNMGGLFYIKSFLW